MPVHRFVVEKLFGSLRHEVEMHTEGLTFLFGLNGSGKTTTLNLLDAIFSRQFDTALRTPFGSLHITLVNGKQITVERDGIVNDRGHDDYILRFLMDGMPTWQYHRSRPGRNSPAQYILRNYPNLRRIGPRVWSDRLTGRRLTLDDISEEYPDFPAELLGLESIPGWLLEFIEEESTYFIRADRLHGNSPNGDPQADSTSPGDDIPQTVESFAEDLAKKLNESLANYGDFSQAKESSFPQRFLEEHRSGSAVELRETVQTRHAQQTALRSRYVAAGLLEPGQDFALPAEFDADKVQFLSAYLDDVDAKLFQLAGIAAKLELFLDIINSKLRRKRIVVDRRLGFRIDADGSNLPLNALSSGEQQEIVLTYGLLFRETPGTLVLIDEPELSLHVAWQFQLVPDFVKIAQLAKLTFLVATHSPQVVNGRDDITIYLNDGAKS
ncbi:AAA family ATPase [Clavibacter michiganensis]|uniref:AAA family ATPase n=1 Tax=Clavibacter michiganensis TaxID=28447 RepID=UPI003EB6EC71